MTKLDEKSDLLTLSYLVDNILFENKYHLIAGPIPAMTAWGAKNQNFPRTKPSTTTVAGTYIQFEHFMTDLGN